MEENVLFALGLTVFAGLSTGIGSALAFFSKTSKRFLSVSLGFSAGVMIYVSMVEIMVKSRDALSASYGNVAGAWYAAISFFAGILIMMIIDRLVPDHENPHEARSQAEIDGSTPPDKLMRMGLFTALAIAIHNFPEGMATFFGALSDPGLGVAIALAIAIHNIPEGISVSVPIYYATGSKKKAFWYSFLSGISEVFGAILGYLVLRPYFSDAVYGAVFGSVAGIMVYISLDELLPTAREYGSGHNAIYGLIAGMAVMALSLLLFM